jgi:hypothetical protein
LTKTDKIIFAGSASGTWFLEALLNFKHIPLANGRCQSAEAFAKVEASQSPLILRIFIKYL